jgi:hydroxyacylglutathione hydrolase
VNSSIHALVDEGLGNSAYLVDLGDGRALAVDPSRDLRQLRALAERHRLHVAFAAETHLHADFVSGSIQLAATGGTSVVASAAGARAFPHRGLAEGDEVDLGGLRLRALATPGHTLEHLSYLLLDGAAPLAIFTGGSLIVGSAARTDLSGDERTEDLARAQYRSLRRLVSELADDTPVLPTHGAGSFCSAPRGGERTSTIGREKATNPLLAAPDEDSFVTALLGGLGTYPPYFARLGEINRQGPEPVAEPVSLPELDAATVRAMLASGAQIVDVRPIAEYSAAHVPGSLSIELRPAFATWLGWLADRDRPIVVMRGSDQDPDEILWQALKIGCENIAGELSGGIDAWRSAGGPVAKTRLVTAGQVRDGEAAGSAVLDIRQASEYAAKHALGAVNLELGRLTELAVAMVDPPNEPLVVMCGHGERAMSAASLLEAAGRRDVAVFAGGPDEWSSAARPRARHG